MSIWADRQIHALNRRLEEFEARLKALEQGDKENTSTAVPQFDKRTKEYREWKNANSSQ